jgi:cytochrome c biogenesis protein CcmG/thiol:disulfide interchange protein DsbE
VVRQDGAIGSDPARGSESIKALVARTMGQIRPAAPSPPPSISIGAPAPTLALPDLEGNTVSLEDFRGSPTFVLFWSQTCGFCQRMIPDLQAWDANPPEGAPKLVVVSRGTVSEHQNLGLQSPVLLGSPGEGAPFGANGTPGGVLIDADGNIASGVARGAPGVFAQIGGGPSPVIPGATPPPRT